MRNHLLPLLLLLAYPLASPAIELQRTGAFAVAADQTLSNELWLAADSVKFQGAAERTLFIQTFTAEFGGTFLRDIWTLADTVQFSGHAAQAVRVAARRSVQIDGRVDGSLIALGETVQIQKPAYLGEDAVLCGQEVIFEGTISNQLFALANSITLAGHVGGTARLIAEEITLMPGTSIAGDVIYTSDKELFAGEGVRIGGKLIRRSKANLGFSLPSLTSPQMLLIQFSFFLAALIVGLPFVALFPLFTTRAVTLLRTQRNKCLLTGAIALALLPMLAVMVAVTWVGLPLGALLLGAYGALLYLAKIIVAIPLAARLLTLRGRPDRPLGALPVLVVGLFLLYVAAALPFIGFAVWLITVLYGMGALVLALLGGQKGLPVVMLSNPPRESPRAPEPPPLDGFSP